MNFKQFMYAQVCKSGKMEFLLIILGNQTNEFLIVVECMTKLALTHLHKVLNSVNL